MAKFIALSGMSARRSWTGLAPDAADQSFCLLQVGETTITSRSANFRIVPEGDIAAAAIAFKKEVEKEEESKQPIPRLAHRPFSDPKLERRYHQIYQEIADKGETPTNERIFAVMEKEAQTEEALDLLREIRDSLH